VCSSDLSHPNCWSFEAISAGDSLTLGPALAIDATIDLPAIRCIQTNTAGEGKSDHIYLLINGVVKGQTKQWQWPHGKTHKTVKTSPKIMAATEKSPATLWQGKLDDGEFVALSVVIMQGTDGKAADGYYKAKTASDKKVDALANGKLNQKQFKSLRRAWNAQNQVFVTGIKKAVPQGKGKGDAYVGLFDVMVANVGGKLLKACTPVGLTEGEHFGTDAKRYTKIKYTRENVLVKDANGQWYEMQMAPVSDDEDILRVKMLRTVLIKQAKGDPIRNVTDYLIDVRVTTGKKVQTWLLPPKGEHPGPTIIHDFWDYAE